jgi:hypothetical protein
MLIAPLDPVPRLRMHGDIPPVPYMYSWRGVKVRTATTLPSLLHTVLNIPDLFSRLFLLIVSCNYIFSGQLGTQWSAVVSDIMYRCHVNHSCVRSPTMLCPYCTCILQPSVGSVNRGTRRPWPAKILTAYPMDRPLTQPNRGKHLCLHGEVHFEGDRKQENFMEVEERDCMNGKMRGVNKRRIQPMAFQISKE